jgi:hypothetical protein
VCPSRITGRGPWCLTRVFSSPVPTPAKVWRSRDAMLTCWSPPAWFPKVVPTLVWTRWSCPSTCRPSGEGHREPRMPASRLQQRTWMRLISKAIPRASCLTMTNPRVSRQSTPVTWCLRPATWRRRSERPHGTDEAYRYVPETNRGQFNGLWTLYETIKGSDQTPTAKNPYVVELIQDTAKARATANLMYGLFHPAALKHMDRICLSFARTLPGSVSTQVHFPV